MRGKATDKLMTADEAARRVADAAVVGIGGTMLYRRPVGLVAALARTGRSERSVVTFSAGYETDLLVEAGGIGTLRTSYAGLEMFGPAPRIRRAVESGDLRYVDETELTLAAGFQAAAWDVPWLPTSHGVLDTDLVSARSDLVEFRDPISERRLLALPSIRLDACLLHVPLADERGNAAFLSTPGLDREMAPACDLVVVSTDEVVSTEELRDRAAGGVDLLEFQVDAVVHLPGGARPTSCYPHYAYDAGRLLTYVGGGDA